MRTLPALIAIVLLLLPSSLGAIAAVRDSCAKMAAMAEMLCCCEHETSSPSDSGPSLSRSCCCEFDAPATPIPSQESPRVQSEEKSESSFLECPFLMPLPWHQGTAPASDPVLLGPPRAPPRPLYLSFQSFLN
ncbi:MAG: hypothetical protein COA70_01170 [Planctomycetota bacterium]|nr:MAG: hypothetical protein COA70_01170 [Planctomycetota bacterium]